MFYTLSLALFFLPCVIVNADVFDSNNKNCSCGFFDSDINEFFTDSIIVYFNETSSLPDDFVAEDYEHKYEKDWNSIFRRGADPRNVRVNQSHSLDLFVSEPTKHHLVRGGSIKTLRRDIQYGSFRSFMKGPRKDVGGSALSMAWQYNETEACELSVMNTDSASEAWVGTFLHNEFTARSLGINFTDSINSTFGNRNYSVLGGNLRNGSVDLWEYTEYRIDWTEDSVNFYIGGNLSRSVMREDHDGLPSIPAALRFEHWSTGNQFSMRGPPRQESEANVNWIRLFFNSSSMTVQRQEELSNNCSVLDVCSVSDVSLRGSTPHTKQATRKWKQAKNKDVKRMPALWISVVCIAISSTLLCHAIVRRAPWRSKHSSTSTAAPQRATFKAGGPISDIPSETHDSGRCLSESSGSQSDSEKSTRHSSLSVSKPVDLIRESSWHGSEDEITISKTEGNSVSSLYNGSSQPDLPCAPSFVRTDSQATTLCVLSPYSGEFNFNVTSEVPLNGNTTKTSSCSVLDQSGSTSKTSSQKSFPVIQISTIPEIQVCSSPVGKPAVPSKEPMPRPTRERIDYLAGLVALCAILVTVMHFGLTFVPAMVIPGAPVHYRSEYWAQKIIAPFILNQMWLGIFFTTSTRFLVASYLKHGNLKDIAKATVRRCPRLMIPVASVALLEYFLIDCGVTKYLRYIPSLTLSTWPYVTRFPTIGHFISEILELIYLIPNAIPQITYNFCTGVLWTLAVQLQGSWLVLTGVIVIYELKTSWKRFAYYAFCIANHWYAESWGSYLWFGLLLADLDITYRYKPWLYSHPMAYYPLMIFCWVCVALGFAANIVPNWTNYNIIAYEHNIHPDPGTGLPIGMTSNAGYPVYYVPRFNGLLFAAGMQAIVELSTTVQAILSFRAFIFLFPHIFTIYLLHGLVFWSWGSWLLIILVDHDFSYGVSLVAVGLTSYLIIFLILPIATPVIESLGKDITALVWMNATERSPPKRRTLFPFPEDLFEKGRGGKSDIEASAGIKANGTSTGEKRDMRGELYDKGKGKQKAELEKM